MAALPPQPLTPAARYARQRHGLHRHHRQRHPRELIRKTSASFSTLACPGGPYFWQRAIVTLSGNDSYSGGTLIDAASTLAVTSVTALLPAIQSPTTASCKSKPEPPPIPSSSEILPAADLKGAGTLIVGQSGGLTGYLRLAVNGPTGTAVSASASTMGGLVINTGSTFDITNNKVVINYGSAADPLTTVRGYIQTAFNKGNWQGIGLTSSSVEAQVAATAGTTNGDWGIGYADGSTDGSTGWSARQQPVLEPTIFGDAGSRRRCFFPGRSGRCSEFGFHNRRLGARRFRFRRRRELRRRFDPRPEPRTRQTAPPRCGPSFPLPLQSHLVPQRLQQMLHRRRRSSIPYSSSTPIAASSDNTDDSILTGQMNGGLLG